MGEAEAAGPGTEWSGSVAAAWERHRQRMFDSQRAAADWLMGYLDPQAGHTILELAAGPGETGFLIAERIGAQGKLISTDLVPEMVDAARRGAAARGLTNADFRVMDAQQIELADNSVDGVICRFGFMLLPNPEQALAETRRVLRPGGKLAYAVLGDPGRNPWMTLIGTAIRRCGHKPSGDPFAPGGAFSLADPERNQAILRRVGFGEARIEQVAGAFHFTDFEEYWGVQREVSGRFAALLSSLPAPEVDAIRTALHEMAVPYQVGGGYELPTLAVVVGAR